MGPDEWKFVTAIAVALLTGGIAYWRSSYEQRKGLDRLEKQGEIRQSEIAKEFENKLRLLETEQELSNQAILEKQLKKYRGLILLSSADLQDRLWHLTVRQAKASKPVLLSEDQDTPSYAAWPMTKRHYLTSTVYLFARYWCWIEILNRTIRFLDFESSERTGEFRNLVKRVERSLAETGLQKASTKPVRSDRPLFQLQQALIGQSIIDSKEGELDCFDFATFSKRYGRLREDFPDYRDLESLLEGAMNSSEGDFHLKRLRLFANSLVALMEFLDPDGILVPESERQRVSTSGLRSTMIDEMLVAGD